MRESVIKDMHKLVGNVGNKGQTRVGAGFGPGIKFRSGSFWNKGIYPQLLKILICT